MNSRKLNRGAEAPNVPGVGPVPWGDIDRYIEEGRRLHAQAVATSVIAAIGLLKHWIGAVSPEVRAQAQAERAARRLRDPEAGAEVTRGFFWPRLSWVAREGARWFGIGAAPERKEGGQRAA